MPELPEVEVVRRGLAKTLLGRQILNVNIRQPRLRWPVPSEIATLALKQTIQNIERRGKYLLIQLEKQSLIVHLGMTGSLVWRGKTDFGGESGLKASRPAPHDHVVFELTGGTLTYNDPRRFGCILWHDPKDGPISQFPLLRKLGVEPFSESFDETNGPALLYQASRGRSLSIKQFLLAGQTVVGVGNIYCSESLFRSGIRPTRAAKTLTKLQCQRLHQQIRSTLAEAIQEGGSSLRDFINAEGQSGYFQLSYFVYDQKGKACKHCGTLIKQVVQQQRSTFFCPRCQP